MSTNYLALDDKVNDIVGSLKIIRARRLGVALKSRPFFFGLSHAHSRFS
jgi:hypothetical protein